MTAGYYDGLGVRDCMLMLLINPLTFYLALCVLWNVYMVIKKPCEESAETPAAEDNKDTDVNNLI